MKKKYKLFILGICSVLIICALAIFLTMKESFANDNIKYIVDDSTMDSYKNYLINNGVGSKNAGKIWSDKTVLSSSLTLDEETDGVTGTITNDSDFLHVYSVLGSSKRLSRLESVPLDVVLLIDVSTSMSAHEADDEAIESANFLIKTLMGDNKEVEYVHPNNRVGIIVYAGGTQVLLPLGHYELEDGQEDYLTLDRVSGNDKLWPKVTTHIKESNEVKNKTSDPMYADSTYLQGALYQGMYLLATEKNTTYTNPQTKVTANRTPILITLTDGGTNVSGATSTGKPEKASIDFWNPLSWTDSSDGKALLPVEGGSTPLSYKNFIPEANGNPFYTTLNNATINTLAPRTLSVLLTAGYMKNWVEDNYTQKSIDGSEISMYGFGIGLNVSGLNSHEKLELNATMNPRKYFTADTENEYIKKSYEAFEQYIKGGSPSLVFDDNYKWIEKTLKASWTFNHPTDTKYDVKSADEVYYIDQYIETDTDSLINVFENMLTTITEQVLKPISGINDVGIKDYLTYIDPIGEYMEVKDIKNVSLFGKLYDVAKDQLKYYVVNADGSVSEYEAKPEKYDYTRQYYKIVPQDGDVQNNLSYKMEDTDGEINYSVTFNLSSIEMYVENKANYNSKIGNFDTYNEKLYINIPRNALPLEVAEIKIDENNKVISYSDNLKEYKESTPLRIYYTVGVEDSIIDEDGLIDLSKVSNEYIEKNTDTVNSKKYVSFYSNYFSNQKISNNSFGDATMSFSPSTSNQFFISNTPLILYEAQEEDQQKKEIILEDDSAYQEFISSHKTVNTVSTDNSNKNYYIIVEYYMPNKENIYHMAILRQGKEFGTGISGQDIKFGEYLCWYSPTGNVWKDFNSTKPDETYTDWVIATKPGGLIAGNMFDDITNKNANNTNTANTYLLPSISDSTTGFSKGNNAVINMYQGNNGKLLVFKNDLIIKKFVSGDLGDINAEWNIKVTLSVPSDQQLNTSYKIVKDDGTTDTLSLVKNEDNEYEGTIKIKDKETLTIKDLPDGTQYKLEEIEANLDNYQTTTKGDLEGTLSGNNPTVEFYNKKYSYHDLTIEKVVNDESNLNKKFNFQIKLIENPNAPLEEEIAYKGTNIDDGTIKFKKAEEGTYIGDITLANEQKITISLPYGTQYEVVEEDANKNGYIATYKNNKGVVNSEVEVTIVNEKDANNPFTVDNLFIYIIVFVASIILIVGLLFIKKKNNVK